MPGIRGIVGLWSIVIVPFSVVSLHWTPWDTPSGVVPPTTSRFLLLLPPERADQICTGARFWCGTRVWLRAAADRQGS